MNLKIIQTQFQQYILSSETAVFTSIDDNAALTAHQKMQIYQNGYYERIIAAMKTDFSILSAMLGDAAFSGLICDYIEAYPSQHNNLRYVGKNLSKFIFEKDNALEGYADLARFEYVMCEAEYQKTELCSIHFQTKFNIIDVWNAFQREGNLIALELRI